MRKEENTQAKERPADENRYEGRNVVLEAYRSGKVIDRLYVLEGCKDGPVMRKGEILWKD